MTIEIRKPEVEQLLREEMLSHHFESADDLISEALLALREKHARGAVSHEKAAPVLTRSQLAGQRIRELRKGATLGGIPIKELIEEGRV